jgi:excisionase family DNA binding protein
MTMNPGVSVEDVANHFGVALDSVYRWIEWRGLPAHKIGRLWKFKQSTRPTWAKRAAS